MIRRSRYGSPGERDRDQTDPGGVAIRSEAGKQGDQWQEREDAAATEHVDVAGTSTARDCQR
jgi:hypothetical protein